jgi:hypothetical protein
VLVRIWGKRNPNPLLVGMQAGATTLEKNWRLFKNLDIDLQLLGIYPKKYNTRYYKCTCTPMYFAVLSQ